MKTDNLLENNDENLNKPDTPTQFVGYEKLIVEDASFQGGWGGWTDSKTQKLEIGSETSLFFDKTPFYGEAGGQAGDKGHVEFPETGERIEITNTRILPGGLYVHDTKVIKLKKGDPSESQWQGS